MKMVFGESGYDESVHKDEIGFDEIGFFFMKVVFDELVFLLPPSHPSPVHPPSVPTARGNLPLPAPSDS